MAVSVAAIRHIRDSGIELGAHVHRKTLCAEGGRKSEATGWRQSGTMNECGGGDVFGWGEQLLSGVLLVKVWGRCSQQRGIRDPCSCRTGQPHELPPAKIMGHNIYMAFIYHSSNADHFYPMSCISYCFFCLSCFSSRPRLVYKSSLSLFSTSPSSSGEAATHVFWPLVICLPSSRSSDSSISPM